MAWYRTRIITVWLNTSTSLKVSRDGTTGLRSSVTGCFDELRAERLILKRCFRLTLSGIEPEISAISHRSAFNPSVAFLKFGSIARARKNALCAFSVSPAAL